VSCSICLIDVPSRRAGFNGTKSTSEAKSAKSSLMVLSSRDYLILACLHPGKPITKKASKAHPALTSKKSAGEISGFRSLDG
jgi:hypothetical protein